MKKYKTAIISIVAIIAVFGLIFLISVLSGNPGLKEIDYAKYTKLKNEKETYFYFGNEADDMDALKSFGKFLDKKIYYINIDKLTAEEKTAIFGEAEISSTLKLYDDGNETYRYENEMKRYLIIKDQIDKGLLKESFVTVTVDEYLELMKEDKYNFMVVGSATCSYCTKFKESINEVSEKYDVNFYYVDLDATSSKDAKRLYATDEVFSGEWGTPQSFIYKNGKKIATIGGYLPTDDLLEKLGEYNVINYTPIVYLQDISYSKYLTLKKEAKEETYFYFGDSETELKFLTLYAKSMKQFIYRVSIEKLTTSQKKEILGTNLSLYTAYKNNKQVYKYSGLFTSYKFQKSLIDANLIEKTVIDVATNDYFDIIKEDEYNIMVIGSATCGHCANYKETIKALLKEEDVNFYYYDLYYKDQVEVQLIYATDDIFKGQWGTPLTFIYKNGNKISLSSGAMSLENLKKILKENGVI